MGGHTVLGDWVSTIADTLGLPDPIDHGHSSGSGKGSSSSDNDSKSSSDSKGGWLDGHNYDD